MSEKQEKYGYQKPLNHIEQMYDAKIGIPSFDLFEDRLKMVLLYEQVKDIRMRKQKIAVVGIYIENLSQEKDEQIKNEVLNRVSENLLKVLPVSCTLARGINYAFWIMVPFLFTREELEVVMDKVQTVLGRGVKINGLDYRLKSKIGVSLFENAPDETVATMVGKAIVALQKTISSGQDIVYFNDLSQV